MRITDFMEHFDSLDAKDQRRIRQILEWGSDLSPKAELMLSVLFAGNALGGVAWKDYERDQEN